jgi:hypothetical protein
MISGKPSFRKAQPSVSFCRIPESQPWTSLKSSKTNLFPLSIKAIVKKIMKSSMEAYAKNTRNTARSSTKWLKRPPAKTNASKPRPKNPSARGRASCWLSPWGCHSPRSSTPLCSPARFIRPCQKCIRCHRLRLQADRRCRDAGFSLKPITRGGC